MSKQRYVVQFPLTVIGKDLDTGPAHHSRLLRLEVYATNSNAAADKLEYVLRRLIAEQYPEDV